MSELKAPILSIRGWNPFPSQNTRCLFTAILVFLLGHSAFAQIDPLFAGELPTLIIEASGLQCPTPSLCYTFNDSDDGARLYRINETGQFISQVVIEDVPHIDFEDIARSNDGRYFVGDFGNNSNDREDLKIYVLSELEGSSVVVPETIEFTYEDQSEFPPENAAMNFDVESMIHWQDSLYLFTRNRTSPYNGITKIYALADVPGQAIAQLRGQIFGNLSEDHSSITAADISPSGIRIVWISKGSLFLFSALGSNLNAANLNYNYFNSVRNYEGVSFIDDCTVLMVEEGTSAGIYSMNTCDILTDIGILDSRLDIDILSYPDHIEMSTALTVDELQIIDSNGRIVYAGPFVSYMRTDHLESGIYIVFLISEKGPYTERIVVMH